MDNFFTVEHYKHGIGTAILIKNRRQRPDDLFMCSFKGKKERYFFCRKHIDEGDEVWWSDGKPKNLIDRRKNKPSLDEALKTLFGGDLPMNF
tara:strand:- start:1280 stop:1555 length:276 start_codon:yes stop_codon:yes gene_type:complete